MLRGGCPGIYKARLVNSKILLSCPSLGFRIPPAPAASAAALAAASAAALASSLAAASAAASAAALPAA